MFVKKSTKMYPVAYQFLKKKVHVAFFSDFNYTPKEILQYESMRNDFDFWKNTFQVKCGVFSYYWVNK